MESDKTTKLFLGVLTLIAVVFVLHVAQTVVALMLIAWLLSHALSPAVDFLMRRLRFPHFLAVILVLVLFLGVFYLIGITVNARVSSLAGAYPEYHVRLAAILKSLSNRIPLTSLPFSNEELGTRLGHFLVSLSGSFLALMTGLVLVFFFLIFMLLGRPYFQLKLPRMLSSSSAEQVNRINNAISRQIGRYLLLQALINLVLGLFVWLALALIGIDFSLTWGLLAFFLNFIPTLGAIVASIPPILVALIQHYPNGWYALICFLSLLFINGAVGYVVIPKVMGNRFDLSPVVVLLSLVFWGWLWGAMGAFLSILIAVAIKIICENVEPLHPVAILMGSGRQTE